MSNNSHDGARDEHKSPERLEQEVDQARNRIVQRVDTLSHRLSPGELLDQALGMAREYGGEFGHNLGAHAKRNPVPLLLTGVGLSWLIMSSNSAHGEYAYDAESLGDRTRDHKENASDSISGAMSKAKGAMRSTADKARDQSEQLKGAAEERMSSASMATRTRAHATQQQLTDFFQQQPILAGGLGIALGAALGALIPETEAENRVAGRASDKMQAQARESAGDQLGKVRDTAKEAAQGARDAAKSSTKTSQSKDQTSGQEARGSTTEQPSASPPGRRV
ncbi:MAG: DUF3618 domain-containing protein [Pseudohongiellaceae bacterium]